MYCTTVGYGNVKGNAKRYRYYQAKIYEQYTTLDGRKVWRLYSNFGNTYRSYNKAETEAKNRATTYNYKYIAGVTQWTPC